MPHFCIITTLILNHITHFTAAVYLHSLCQYLCTRSVLLYSLWCFHFKETLITSSAIVEGKKQVVFLFSSFFPVECLCLDKCSGCRLCDGDMQHGHWLQASYCIHLTHTGASNKVQLDILRWCLFFICLIILSNYFITFGWCLMLILRGDLLSVSDLHYFDLDLKCWWMEYWSASTNGY